MPFSPEASYADSFDLSQRTYARRQDHRNDKQHNQAERQARMVIMKSY